MTIKPEIQLIIYASKIQLTEIEVFNMNNLIAKIDDWEYLFRYANERQAGSLLYTKLVLLQNQDLIPQNIKLKLKQVWFKTLSRCMIMIVHFQEVIEVFNTVGIPVIALKGIYLSDWLYKEVGLRQFSDIDLLVKEEDAQLAIEQLSILGYNVHASNVRIPQVVSSNANTTHLPAMIKDGVSIEIHTRINNKYSKFNIDKDSLWKNTISKNIHKSSVLVFNNEYLLITLVIHLDKHFKLGKFQFTSVYDIANLITNYKNDIDWTFLIEECNVLHVKDLILKYLYLIDIYFDLNLPTVILRDKTKIKIDYELKVFNDCLIYGQSTLIEKRGYLSNVNSIDKFNVKIIYFYSLVFPPVSFMLDRYSLVSKWQLIYYYPYRLIYGSLKEIKNLISTNQ